MRKCPCVTFFLGLFLMGSIGAAVLYLMRGRLLQGYGQWLMAGEGGSANWEVLFVLSGRPFERGIHAATVWRRHPTRIFLTGGLYNDNLLASGCPVYMECEMTRKVLIDHCVPDSVIITTCHGSSTYEEILLIRQLCLTRGYRKIGIVSSAFHGRRLQLLAQRYLEPAGVSLRLLPARPMLFLPEIWWKSEYGLLNAFEESVKLGYYWLLGWV